jgi:hypothetical protein
MHTPYAIRGNGEPDGIAPSGFIATDGSGFYAQSCFNFQILGFGQTAIFCQAPSVLKKLRKPNRNNHFQPQPKVPINSPQPTKIEIDNKKTERPGEHPGLISFQSNILAINPIGSIF